MDNHATSRPNFKTSQVLQQSWLAIRNNWIEIGTLGAFAGLPMGFLLVTLVVDTSRLSTFPEYIICFMSRRLGDGDTLYCESSYSIERGLIRECLRYLYFLMFRTAVIRLISRTPTTHERAGKTAKWPVIDVRDLQFFHRTYWLGVLRIAAIDLAIALALVNILGAGLGGFIAWRHASFTLTTTTDVLNRVFTVALAGSIIGVFTVVARWSLGASITVLEGSGIRDSLSHSWQLSAFSWPKLLLFQSSIVAVHYVIMAPVYFLATGQFARVLYLLVSLIMNAILTIAMTVCYHQLRSDSADRVSK